MNSEFHLINDDDVSAFDIGTPAFLSSSWSSPTKEGLHPSKTDGQEFIVFIEPTVSTLIMFYKQQMNNGTSVLFYTF